MPHPPPSPSRVSPAGWTLATSVIVLGTLIATTPWGRRTPKPRRAVVAPQVQSTAAVPAVLMPGTEPTGATADAAAGAALMTNRSPAELKQWVAALYRREQLTRELALEQERYGEHYWDSERSPAELAAQRRTYAHWLRDITDEANQMLRRLGVNEPLTLAPLFDADHPGPNLRFLSESDRTAFTAALADAPQLEPAALLALAQRTLSAGDLATYWQWNGPGAAATREELLGFGATQAEFDAIRQTEASLGGEDSAVIDTALQTQLTPERFVMLTQMRDPALQTAVRTLHRLGGSPEQAAWLAATRQTAIADVAAIQANAQLSTDQKRERIDSVQRGFAQAVATRLALRAVSLDEFEPAP